MRSAGYNPLTNDFSEVDSDVSSDLPQIMWHITDRCPLACPYCFATKTSHEASLEQVPDIVATMLLLNVRKVDIAGGEPLVYPHLPELVLALGEAKLPVTITTSGAATSGNRDWLVSNAALFTRVIVSLDAPPQQHDSMRGREGAFDAAVQIIDKIQQSGYKHVRVNTVLTRVALEPTYAQAMATLIGRIGPEEWCLIQPHPANKKRGFDDYAITDQEFAEIVRTLQGISIKSAASSKILSRKVSDYSGYWVLYPNGILRRHSDGPADVSELHFDPQNVTEIRTAVRKYGISLPLRASRS
jgi:molybdenum cofactor biosynthesis enzyme MoaA